MTNATQSNRRPIEINVFWNSQPDRECWSYHAHDNDGLFASGNLETVADDDLAGAIDQACYELDVELTHDDFACDRRSGGTWQGEVKTNATAAQDTDIPCAWCDGIGTLDANPDGSGVGETCSHCEGTGCVVD